MRKLTLFAIYNLSFFLFGCGPKVNQCVVDFPIWKAYCTNIDSGKKQDRSLSELNKYSCLSPDDFASLLRGSNKSVSLCIVIDADDNTVYCNTPNGSFMTTMETLHKYSCFTADDFATFMRAIKAKKA